MTLFRLGALLVFLSLQTPLWAKAPHVQTPRRGMDRGLSQASPRGTERQGTDFFRLLPHRGLVNPRPDDSRLRALLDAFVQGVHGRKVAGVLRTGNNDAPPSNATAVPDRSSPWLSLPAYLLYGFVTLTLMGLYLRRQSGFQRNLEQKVEERTRELESRYHELDTMDTIVRTVNRELKFSNMVHVMLEQALRLFPTVQRASLVMYDPELHRFSIKDCVGLQNEEFRGHYDAVYALETLWASVTTLEEGLYMVRKESIHLHPGNARTRMNLDVSASKASMALICLDHLEDPNGLDDLDRDRLRRFREHARTAVIKAHQINDMLETQMGLLEEAHEAGKAEIAAGVMHNMGNNLNSVKTSVHVMEEAFHNTRHLDVFARINQTLAEQDDLADFFSDPKRAQQVIRALQLIHGELAKTCGQVHDESRRLLGQVDNMTRLLREQQQYTDAHGRLFEPTDLNQLIDGALRREDLLLLKSDVSLNLKTIQIPPIRLERAKTLRAVLFLLRNAREAVEEIEGSRKIDITVERRPGGASLSISDNGVGISAEHVGRVFAQGFSTKKDHQGMGLHYAANVMKDAGGEIKLHSDGPGKGARVTLLFPVEQPTEE